MALRKVCISSMNDTHGTSLIEIVLSVSMLAFMAVIAVPVSMGWYRTYSLNSEMNKIWFVLATARAQAQANVKNQPAGVWFGEHSYVLFSGNNYDVNDPTLVQFALDESIRMTSTQDKIIFQNISALSAGGTVTLRTGNASTTISVNTEGHMW